MDKPMRPVTARGVELPVEQSLSPTGRTGVAFAALDGSVVISLTRGEDGMCVKLDGDMIDYVAGLFADAVSVATRQSHPSLGGIQ